jgi:hypothetical protein
MPSSQYPRPRSHVPARFVSQLFEFGSQPQRSVGSSPWAWKSKLTAFLDDMPAQ